MAAHRGMENPFSGCTRVGPRAHLSAENRSTSYQSQLTPSQPRKRLVERGKAQSNTNKHEDQQMALCQSSSLSFFLFFLSHHASLCSPSSFTHLNLILTTHIIFFISFIFLSISFFFLPPLVSSIPPFVHSWSGIECDVSSVRCPSLLLHTV